MASLPWVVMGIVVAVMLVNFNRKKCKLNIEKQNGTDEENSMSTECENDYMSVGMCFGSVLSLSGIVTLSYGISFGMLIGMTVGMYIKKR